MTYAFRTHKSPQGMAKMVAGDGGAPFAPQSSADVAYGALLIIAKTLGLAVLCGRSLCSLCLCGEPP
jgi:hypothetical protein